MIYEYQVMAAIDCLFEMNEKLIFERDPIETVTSDKNIVKHNIILIIPADKKE